MTPTSEQVIAERGRAESFWRGLGLDAGEAAIHVLATALAARAIEARMEALREALDIAMLVYDDPHESNPASAAAGRIAEDIRALLVKP